MVHGVHGIDLIDKILELQMVKLISESSDSPKVEMDLPPLMSNPWASLVLVESIPLSTVHQRSFIGYPFVPEEIYPISKPTL